MRISIFGLGYVGSVSAACLAELGHEVFGVDIMPEKVESLKKGIAPVKEPQLNELLEKNLKNGRLTFTTDVTEACLNSDFAMITVGTPSHENGTISLNALERCVESIAVAVKKSTKQHFTIIIRSTVPPTTTSRMHKIANNITGQNGQLSFCVNPEFLREGSAVDDFFNPALVVIGIDEETLKPSLQNIYNGVNVQHIWLDTPTAELIKYTNNAFHALKVTFANEISRLAEGYGADGDKVMKILCADKKLNISTEYLRPGFAFGGSCLPKDIRGINAIAREKEVELPMLGAVLDSNTVHIENYKRQILNLGVTKVGILGMTFKPGTDDLRESASLRLIQFLLKENIAIKMTDTNLDPAKLMGANLQYIDQLIPAWRTYFCDSAEEVFAFSDTIIMTTNESVHTKWIKKFGKEKFIFNLTENSKPIPPSQITDSSQHKPVAR